MPTPHNLFWSNKDQMEVFLKKQKKRQRQSTILCSDQDRISKKHFQKSKLFSHTATSKLTASLCVTANLEASTENCNQNWKGRAFFTVVSMGSLVKLWTRICHLPWMSVYIPYTFWKQQENQSGDEGYAADVTELSLVNRHPASFSLNRRNWRYCICLHIVK